MIPNIGLESSAEIGGGCVGSTKIKRPKVLGYSVYLGEIQEFTTALLTSLSKLKVYAGG